ncbi:uncharacterized protein [Choristoneura fumiferana]|uniref:uncharacterized protein n=1 Tax=Choristoneura fumiferana TaxID=7141 RepID=UPI003D155B2C
MESLALVLFILAIIVHFNGVLCENDSINKEIDKFHRFKRSHEHDKTLNSTKTKEQGNIVTEKSKKEVANKKSEQIAPKIRPKIEKDEPKERYSKIVNIKQIEKSVNPRNLQHFIEDIDEELPVPAKHIQINEHQLKENVKPVLNNETSKGTKPAQNDKIENIPKKVLPENTTKESSQSSIKKLKTGDPGNDKNATAKSPLDLSGQLSAKLVNRTKEADKKSVQSVCKLPKNESDNKKQGAESSIIEIKEHKYEEEIVRYYPTKACQPNIKRHWEASQNFNPQFSKSPYIQAMNPNQGLSEADPYQRVKYNKENYVSAYTCVNLKDQRNGNYFYANFDVKPYNPAKNERIYQGYNYDRIRKVWLDRDTKIITAIKPDACVQTNVKSYITDESYPYLNKR